MEGPAKVAEIKHKTRQRDARIVVSNRCFIKCVSVERLISIKSIEIAPLNWKGELPCTSFRRLHTID
jgi:hypothetical protein